MTEKSPTKTILITGATDGIGLALAHHYQSHASIDDPIRLMLLGRRSFTETPLAAFRPNNYCQVDLNRFDCAEIVDRFLNERQIHELDLVIQNAGTGYYGSVTAQSLQSIQDVIAVNVWAPVALTHQLLPRVRRRQGKIVFISSVVANLANPDYAVYGASKAALDGFVRNLRIELGSTVRLQVIHPGATRTGMHYKSGLSRKVIDWTQFPTAEAIAADIAAAINTNRSSVTIGAGNKLLAFAGRYLGGLIDPVIRKRHESRSL